MEGDGSMWKHYLLSDPEVLLGKGSIKEKKGKSVVFYHTLGGDGGVSEGSEKTTLFFGS